LGDLKLVSKGGYIFPDATVTNGDSTIDEMNNDSDNTVLDEKG
jgi:hypothetical protein